MLGIGRLNIFVVLENGKRGFLEKGFRIRTKDIEEAKRLCDEWNNKEGVKEANIFKTPAFGSSDNYCCYSPSRGIDYLEPLRKEAKDVEEGEKRLYGIKTIKLNEKTLRSIIRESLEEYVSSLGDYPVGSNTSDAPWNQSSDDRDLEYDTKEKRLSTIPFLKVLCDGICDVSVLDYYRESGLLPEVTVVEIEYSFIRRAVGMNDFGNTDYENEDENIEEVRCFFIDDNGRKMTFDKLIQYLSSIRMKGIGSIIKVIKCARDSFNEMTNDNYGFSDWEYFFDEVNKII